MPKQARAKGLQLDEGFQATADRLVQLLMPYASILRLDMYGSISFTAGIEKTVLVRFLALLTDLVRLDVRGGFFNQKLLTAAVRRVMTDDESFLLHVVEQAVSFSNGVEMVGYKIRVMLAHLRIGFNTRSETESGSTDFDAIYKLMIRSGT